MIRWLLPILLLCSLVSCGDEAEYQAWLANEAEAADQFCGVDTDRNGSVDNLCPEPDKDHDGYVSSTSYTSPMGSAVDCDDTNFWIQPGSEDTAGCSAGNYRTCQSDGTWSSCSAISGFTCHTGAGSSTTFWMSTSGSTSGGCGSYASPCNYTCFSNTALGCYRAPVAGDCLVLKAGTYSGSSWTSTLTGGSKPATIEVNNKDGTSSDPIVLRGEPGVAGTYPILMGPGTPTSAESQGAIYLFGSDYWRVKDLEIDGTGGYSNTGVHLDGGTGLEVFRTYIHDIDGNEDNNVSCIKFRQGTVNGYVHDNLVRDCAETSGAGPTQQNNVQIRWMDETGYGKALFNVIPNSTLTGGGIDCKHAEDTATYLFQGNFVRNVQVYALASENKETTVINNWVADCDAYALIYKGIGDVEAWFKDSVFSYNTVQRCGLLGVSADWDDATNHQNYSGTTVFTADHNIMEDDNASYDGDEGDGVTRMCEYNCTSGEFAAASGKCIWSNNVYYSSGTSTLRFGYFGQAGGGADYSSLASWQGAGFDTGSVQANPSLDADGISASYPNHGWMAGLYTAAATPTPTPQPAFMPYLQ